MWRPPRSGAAEAGARLVIAVGRDADEYKECWRLSNWSRGVRGRTPALAISYTSSTTSRPKSVASYRRGAYLEALTTAPSGLTGRQGS